MENRIYNGQNGLWYELQGDYYIPCIALSDEEQVEIGVWGLSLIHIYAAPSFLFVKFVNYYLPAAPPVLLSIFFSL